MILFDTVHGFRKSDCLSCDFVNFVKESVLENRECILVALFFRKKVQLPVHADDIGVIGRTRRDVITAFRIIELESAEIYLAVNEGKAKY